MGPACGAMQASARCQFQHGCAPRHIVIVKKGFGWASGLPSKTCKQENGMKSLKRLVVVTMVCLLAAIVGLAAGVETPSSVSFTGAIARSGTLDSSVTQGLEQYQRLLKVAGANGHYRAAVEVKGYALRDVLNQFEVKKKTDDGFDRPLDTLVVVKGRDGSQVLLSYSEIYFAADEGPLLVPQARLLLPHHHNPIEAGANDPTAFHSVAERGQIDVRSCETCHHGDSPMPLVWVPKGWLLVVPQDGFGGRFVEDVTEITVRQVGISVQENREKAKSAVTEPVVVGLDGKQTKVTPELLKQATQRTFKDAAFGMGMGFHGERTWEGADLGSLLRPLLPAGADPRKMWVLVTAEDGYRSVYSGSEVFEAPQGKGVMIVDRINSEPLGAGSGRYHILATHDFYVDRDVHQVKEIRLGLMQ
jgi:hypothetical protein